VRPSLSSDLVNEFPSLADTPDKREIDFANNLPSRAFSQDGQGRPLEVLFRFEQRQRQGPGNRLLISQAKWLGLTAADMFVPASGNRKPFLRRKV